MSEKTSKTEQVKSWFDSTAAKITGAVFAVGATLITARDAISRGFFKTMNKGEHGAFVDLQNTRDDEIAKVIGRAKIDSTVNVPKEVKIINKTYEDGYQAQRKILKFKNVFDEWEVLKTHQRREVMFATAAVASVAVGAIMAIASSRSAAKRHEERAEQQNTATVQSR